MFTAAADILSTYLESMIPLWTSEDTPTTKMKGEPGGGRLAKRKCERRAWGDQALEL